MQILQTPSMLIPQTRRRRGVHLTPSALKKLTEAISALEYQENFGNYYTLQELSERTRLDSVTIARVLEGKRGVDKRTLERFFRAVELKLDSSDYSIPVPKSEASRGLQKSYPGFPLRAEISSQCKVTPQSHQDLREAVDIPAFYGRTEELAKAKQWILRERCRVVAILGMGGIGKTAFAAKLVEQLVQQFDYVIWKSLRNAPLPSEVIFSLLQFLYQEQEVELPQSFGSGINLLLNCLCNSRCLVVLDNLESILCSGEYAGSYRTDYEGYGELLRCLGEGQHQSCVLLTSREKPREFTLLEGSSTATRSFVLGGLDQAAGQQLLTSQGNFVATPQEWQVVIEHYSGNPLALKVVAATVLESLSGNPSVFLEYGQQGVLVFSEIGDLLKAQMARLTQLERTVMNWLAVHREEVAVQALQGDLVALMSAAQLLNAVQSLRRRSLVEYNGMSFTLQPMVMEYVTDKLVRGVVEEIVNPVKTQGLGSLLRNVALLIPQAKDYVKEVQLRVLLTPIVEGLIARFGSVKAVTECLRVMVTELKENTPQERGYRVGNILNLLVYLGVEERGWDLLQSTMWQVDSQNLTLRLKTARGILGANPRYLTSYQIGSHQYRFRKISFCDIQPTDADGLSGRRMS